MTQRSPSSAATRLVQRAGRPAVRAIGGPAALHDVEIAEPLPPPAAPVPAPWPNGDRAPGAAASPTVAAVRAPVAATVAAARPARLPDPPRPPDAAHPAPSPVPPAFGEVPRPARDPLGERPEIARPAPRVRSAAPQPLPPAPAAVLPSGELPEHREPIGWQGLAEDGPVDVPAAPGPAPSALVWAHEAPPPPPPPPARAPADRRDDGPAMAAAGVQEPVPSTTLVVARPVAPSPGSHAPSAAPAVAPPATPPAGPPQVLIDRIEVITPPARGPAPDPMASLVDRRRGASRHARGGR